MKSKRRAPARYHVIWRSRGLGWHEAVNFRIPKDADSWIFPMRIEDLKTGEVLKSNFDLRQSALVATREWPKRKAALRAIKRFYAPKQKPVVNRLAKLREREKTWLKKLRTAETKLKKIRAALRRLDRKTPDTTQCGNCLNGKLVMSGETCGVCGFSQP